MATIRVGPARHVGGCIRRSAHAVPQYEIIYATDRPSEMVEADRVSVQPSDGQVVLHKTVLVIGLPREIVIRRLFDAEVKSVDEIGQPD